MEVWREHMPKGMLLKSDGFASNLSDPASSFTLKHFCAERGIPYDDTRLPVAIETFVDYAQTFQQKLVPQLDTRQVTRIDRTAGHYTIQLADGETVTARRVVLAVGISHFAYIPPCFDGLPAELLSHSSNHNDSSIFRGKKVTVIGGGASAIDLAALMHENGADVSIVARSAAIRFHNMPGPGQRTLWQRMRNPSSGLGPGWKSRFYTDAPGLFRYFPENLRLSIVRKHLGPAPGWPMKKRVLGKVPMLLGRDIAQAQASNGGVRLTLTSKDGRMEEHETGHVVAATGYRPDIRRLHFLEKTLQDQVSIVANAPVLSSDFQSSAPGLYFVGIAAANNFGPMMRFAYGSDYTARRLAKHLQKQVRQ
jgi:thioredoxin reductase